MLWPTVLAAYTTLILLGVDKLLQACHGSISTQTALTLSAGYSGEKSALFKDSREINPETISHVRTAKLHVP